MVVVKMQLVPTRTALTLVNVRMDILEMDSIVQVGYLLKLIFDISVYHHTYAKGKRLDKLCRTRYLY